MMHCSTSSFLVSSFWRLRSMRLAITHHSLSPTTRAARSQALITSTSRTFNWSSRHFKKSARSFSPLRGLSAVMTISNCASLRQTIDNPLHLVVDLVEFSQQDCHFSHG